MDSMQIGAEILGMPDALAQIKQFSQAIRQVPAVIKVTADTSAVNKIARIQRQAMVAPSAVAPAPMQKAQGQPDLVRQLNTVLMSSRFGAGGLMPLVGQTLKLLPPQFRLVAAAVAAFGKVTMDAAKEMMDARRAQYESGATLQESIGLNTTGRGLGLSPSDIGEMARTLSDSLQSSPFAQGMGAQAGIHDYGFFDTVDKAKNLQKAISYIMNTKSTDDAIRAARAWHLEQALIGRDLSDQTKKQLALDAAFRQGLTSQQDVKNAAEFTTALDRMKGSFSDLTMVIGQKFLPVLTAMMNNLTDAEESMTRMIRNLGDNPESRAVKEAKNGAIDSIKPSAQIREMQGRTPMENLREWIKGAVMPGYKNSDASKDHQDAVDRNTDALNRQTAWQMKAGTYGGGPRAQNAFPKGWTGGNFNAWGPGGAAALGAFQL